MSDKPNPQGSRTFKPNGALCKKLREDRGWEVAAMAAKAGLTTKTIASIEAGNPCFLFTLKGISDALELADVSQLIASGEPSVPPPPSGKRVQMKIKVILPFADSDFTKWLVWFVNKLIKLIDPDGEMEIVGIAPGSIIITLEMTEKDTRKTVSAFASGELDELEIDSISTNFGHGELQEFRAIRKTIPPPTPRSPPLPPPVPPKEKQSESGSTYSGSDPNSAVPPAAGIAAGVATGAVAGFVVGGPIGAGIGSLIGGLIGVTAAVTAAKNKRSKDKEPGSTLKK
jgi:DNA-binding XRE family transcriptional regulator